MSLNQSYQTDLYEYINSLIQEMIVVSIYEINFDSTWWDLDIDSLDVLSIMLSIEKQYDICISDEEVELADTPFKLRKLVERKLNVIN